VLGLFSSNPPERNTSLSIVMRVIVRTLYSRGAISLVRELPCRSFTMRTPRDVKYLDTAEGPECP